MGVEISHAAEERISINPAEPPQNSGILRDCSSTTTPGHRIPPTSLYTRNYLPYNSIAMETSNFIRFRKEGYVKRIRHKVYFSATKEDYDGYSSEYVIKQLLNAYDCDIYVKNPKAEMTEDDLALHLSEMDAAFIHLTSSYFDALDNNQATDLAILRNQKTKLIPLMETVSPEAIRHYNRYFPNIQYISLNQEATELPYLQKVQIVLEDLFEKDDVASANVNFIRKLFLSYRKKNRGLAMDLIKAIHQDPRLEGVEIWYDEFLSAGENFEEDIKRELETSDGVLLLMTKEMLEEDNYVISTEYPLIRSLGKPITPVIVDTDVSASEIQNKFPSLELLREDYRPYFKQLDALKESLVRSLKLEKEERKPEEDYGLGLLYFNGIRVEKNEEKGAQLIKKAAEGGCFDAFSKAAKLYYDGLYLPGSLYKAIYFNNECLQKAARESSFDNVLQALYDGSNYHIRNNEFEDYNLLQRIFYNKIVDAGTYHPLLVKNNRERVRVYLLLDDIEGAEQTYRDWDTYCEKVEDEQERKRIKAERELMSRYISASKGDFLEAFSPILSETIEGYPFLEINQYMFAVGECELYIMEKYLERCENEERDDEILFSIFSIWYSFTYLVKLTEKDELTFEEKELKVLLDIYRLAAKGNPKIVEVEASLPVLFKDLPEENELIKQDCDLFGELFLRNRERFCVSLTKYFICLTTAAELDENYLFALFVLKGIDDFAHTFTEDYWEYIEKSIDRLPEYFNEKNIASAKAKANFFLAKLGLVQSVESNW